MPFRALRWRNLLPGAVILAALAALAAATLKYARIGALRGDTLRYYAAFPAARNVMGGTEVWINGTKVGRVKNVHFAPPSADTSRRVVIEFDVLARYRGQIRENSIALLGTGTRVMGQTVLALTAGTSDARVVPANDTLRGSAGPDVQAFTSSFGEVAPEVHAIVANVRALSSSLASTRGTLGALTALDAPKRLEALAGNAAKLGERATSGDGTIALALRRGQLIARAKAAAAQADSIRQLLASDKASLGRFRRDSTLIRAVSDLRDELSITSALLATQSGSLARFGQDSILAVQMAEKRRQMTELFADIKKRPFRYIAF